MAETETLLDPNAPIWATGRRKTSVASIRLIPGKGVLKVNAKTLEDYFGGHLRQKLEISEVLEYAKAFNDKDIIVEVYGGGISAQAGAIRHGIARALSKLDPKLRVQLRKIGFLTRDDRMVERKKPGQPGARKRYQYSKR